MSNRFTKLSLLVVFSLTALIWYGCSDDTIRTVMSQDDYTPPDETSSFLPLSEGFTTIYRVTYSNGSGQTITLKIGRQVQLMSITAHEWFSDNGTTLDTGYVRITSDAIFFYDGVLAEPEKILGFPLVAGNSWLRFSETYGGGGDSGDSGDPDDNLPSMTDGVVAKAFPSTGANVMTVVGQEQLQLSNGDVLSHTVKVYNESSSPGKKNYYWYAQNIGLVKYLIGTTDNSYPRADITGELIDFGT